MKTSTAICILIGSTIGVALCGCVDDSTQIQARQQEITSLQAVQSVGMPATPNHAEMRMMKDIIEKRDQNVATTTYITDMNGRLHKRCNSIGYGLPYATQYTNPQQIRPGGVIAQADPNGLYSPAAAEGTWVMCVNPKDKIAYAVYIEDRVTVSPFPLEDN